MSDPSKPLCVLAGYFGYGNAGDELIHQTLRRHVASVRWALLWPPEVPSPDGVETVNRWDFIRLARVFRKAKALVLGGGELFQARTSFASLLYYVGIVFWAKAWGCDVWAFGMGVDPELPPLGKWLVRRALAKASALWVRDGEAFRILQGLRPGMKISLAPDPVWAWTVQSQTVPPSLEPRRVLWVLRSVNADQDEEAELSALLGDLASRRSFEHGFLCLQPSLDMSLLAERFSGMPFFHRLETWTRTDELPAIIQRYDVVVTMRFHGIVLANLSDRPAVALSGHAKVAQLAADMGWPVVPRSGADAGSLERAIRQAWELRGSAARSALDRGDAARRALAELDTDLSKVV